MRIDTGSSFGDFYPRSPCGERRSVHPETRRRDAISIHALLAESDKPIARHSGPLHDFYPRSPCGERPCTAETDMTLIDFYPRSPCGERPMQIVIVVMDALFLSTLSLRRATAKVHKTVGHFCAYGTNFMGIASSC